MIFRNNAACDYTNYNNRTNEMNSTQRIHSLLIDHLKSNRIHRRSARMEYNIKDTQGRVAVNA